MAHPTISINPVRNAYAVQYTPASGSGDVTTGSSLLSYTLEALISGAPDLEAGEKILAIGFGEHPLLGQVTYAGAVEVGSSFIGYMLDYNGQYYLISNSPPGLSPGESFTVYPSIGWDAATNEPLCFLPGTMIATPHGEVAVETLRPGDLVSLAYGGAAPVVWLGRQTVATRFADPLRTQPVRVMAHALADGVPARDLLLSPGHALLVDGLLAQAGALVNGTSIRREAEMPEIFVYYHIELATHELVLAENTPAESFIDHADRLAFDNWDEHVQDHAIEEMELPRAKSARQLPGGLRIALAERGAAIYGTTGEVAA